MADDTVDDARLQVVIAIDDLVANARIHEDTPEYRQAVTDSIDALIAAVRAETIEEAITFIQARGDIETAVVAPGMWFAAGYLREDFPR